MISILPSTFGNRISRWYDINARYRRGCMPVPGLWLFAAELNCGDCPARFFVSLGVRVWWRIWFCWRGNGRFVVCCVEWHCVGFVRGFMGWNCVLFYSILLFLCWCTYSMGMGWGVGYRVGWTIYIYNPGRGSWVWARGLRDIRLV